LQTYTPYPTQGLDRRPWDNLGGESMAKRPSPTSSDDRERRELVASILTRTGFGPLPPMRAVSGCLWIPYSVPSRDEVRRS